MLKIRYFEIRLIAGVGFDRLSESAYQVSDFNGIAIIKSTASELVLHLTTTRQISVVQFLTDGSKVPGTAATMEQYLLRFFRFDSRIFLSLIDPPRGSRLITDLLSQLLPEQSYFVESLEFRRALIQRHVAIFESSKLVSAKVRDFQIYEKAVARLEVTSKEGLQQSIAPFLEKKFHRIESLTYEVTHQFKKGLVQYLANGTLRVSPSLVEFGVPSFERELEAI